MDETPVDPCGWTLVGRQVAGALLSLAAFGWGAPARGQACYAPSSPQYYSDMCDAVTAGQTYEYNQALLSFYTIQGGSPYLLACTNSAIGVYDATSPATMSTPLLSLHIPWDWTTIKLVDSHAPMYQHIFDVATLPADGSFPYALVSLGNYGWDFLKLGGAGSKFLGNGYQPAAVLSFAYKSAAMFAVGGDVYVVAQALDATSIANNDFSIRIYHISSVTGLSPATISSATMGQGVRVPIGQAGDPIDNTQFPLGAGFRFIVLTDNSSAGHRVLLVRGGAGVAVVNIDNPSIPVPLEVNTQAGTDTAGSWAADRSRHVVWGASASTTVVNGYLVDTSRLPAASSLVLQPAYTNVNYDITDGSAKTIVGGTAGVGVSGDLLTASAVITGQSSYQVGSRIGYMSLAGTNPLAIGAVVPYTSLDLTRTCQNSAYYEIAKGATPFLANGNYYASLSLQVDFEVVGIAGSCMATTPVPRLTVTPPATGASCGTNSGFPGDAYTLTNASAGQWVGYPVTLTVSPPSAGTITGPDGQNSYTWASSPSDAPGMYTFTLTVHDATGTAYQTTATVNLCANPAASLQVVAVSGVPCSGATCSYLTGDTLTLSAAPPISQGSPAQYYWSWLEPVSNVSGTSGTVPLAQQGTYTVWVAAVYGFTGAQSGCSNAPAALTSQVGTSTDYVSCAELTADSQPFYLGPVTVQQTGSTLPNLITSQPITVSTPYKIAANYSAAFSWSGTASTPGAASPPSVSAGSQQSIGTVTGTIASPSVGNAQTVTLAGTATGATTVPLTSTSAPFNVTTCVPPGPATNTSPAAGATGVPYGTVTFSWSAPTTGTGPFTYDVVPNPNLLNLRICAGVVGTTCTGVVGQGTTLNWQVIAHVGCSSATSASNVTSFTTTSYTPPPPTPTPTPTPTGGRLTITPSPNPANAGQAVTFSFSPRLAQSGDYVNFSFGDGHTASASYPSCSVVAGGLACGQTSNTYAAQGTFAVSGAGVAGGVSVSGSTTVTVTQVCTLPAPPAASFTYAKSNLAVQFSDASSGTPTAWSWSFGDGAGPIPGGTSSAQNPIYTFKAAGTYTVTLTASNCKGQSQSQQTITVSTCSQSAAPTANFTAGPTGALAGFPEQQQPYVGQPITLTDASTNGPTSWHWYDFNELAVNQTVTTPTFTFTWPASQPPGLKNVRMTATNCVGTSAEVMKQIQIYPDVRHAVADFTWSGGTLATGSPVTLAADTGSSYGDPDTFTWTFDDGTPQQVGASITHTYTCAGTHAVSLTASRSNYAAATATTSHTLTLTGQQCGPQSVMTVDAANLAGVNDTYWLTNVRLFNPSSQTSQITVEFRPIGWGNNTAGATVPVNPYATLVLNDVIAWGRQQGLFGADVKKAALRILYSNPAGVAPVVTSETYTTPPGGGGTYGQLNPGIEVVPNTTPSALWITGIRNNGPTSGFRTNYSVLNLRDTSVSNLVFTLLDPTGKTVAEQSVNLSAYEYRQDTLANLFGGASAATSPNPLAIKVAVPGGSDVQAYTSVVDNLTGDPVLIPAVPPPAAPIYIPAVAYTPGANGTVWRSDMQLTNPDSANPHTWNVTYTPGGQTTVTGIMTQKPTVSAQSSVRYDDLLSWLYDGRLTDADKTSGVIEITPADGGNVYPIVQARSFNQTASGTFGQNLTPITPDMGVVAGQGKRLLLTGMSSQDVARTNLGFVSLSDTSGINFSVVFYDEGGNVLNPKDGQGNPIPYTFALGPDGWDQDKLENRFHNAGWATLPSGQRAISAVIQVTDGGPGTVYATVIDNFTGDPNFILAQSAP